MSTNDVEIIQSFCRRYINRAVKDHFRDIDTDDPAALSLDIPRQVIKRICLHEDKDNLLLTIVRLLFWWIEARGLFDEFIYGMPAEDFHITKTIYPQVKLHFRENKYDAYDNSRKQARSEVSFRWREEDFTTTNINALVNKIALDIGTPPLTYRKGRTRYTYTDKTKGYYFQVNADTEADAKKIIEATIRIQDDVEPDWENNFREHKDNKNYTVQETVRVMGETIRKPKKRPIATVKFAYAELFIPGVNKPIILCDVSGNKIGALRYL